MTFVGKLLVIIQLVLSICFMALAGAVFTRHTQWQVKYTEEVAAKASVEKELERERADLKVIEDSLNEKVKTLQASLDDEVNKKNAAEQDRDLLVVQLSTEKTKVNTAESLEQIAAAEAENRRDEAILRLEQNKVLNTKVNEQDSIIQQQEDELFNREVERRTIVVRYSDLLSQVAIYRKVLAANGFDTDPKAYARTVAPTPLVFGEVVETRRSAKTGRELVEISLGSDDGIKDGDTLFVYRVGERNQYLGEITVELVRPKNAVGIVVNKAKNGVIEAKDHVTTRL
ncbi:MAG: hypothetical protein O2820_10685 [Planctomycetota bacterium]|nr:hypothetical protein [Planctomycetota bacterium]MDA1249676.1 hypothetical protein [Planctomycetota bacterium]